MKTIIANRRHRGGNRNAGACWQRRRPWSLHLQCHSAGSGTVTVDENKSTLTWRGMTFRNLKQVEGGKVTWQASNNDVTAEFSTATKGVADLTIGKDKFDCQMVR
jgi:hypothetical protein